MSKRDRKRCFLERAARARAGKRSRIEAERGPDTILERAPGPSSSLIEGKQAGKEVEQAINVYKSHRRIFLRLDYGIATLPN